MYIKVKKKWQFTLDIAMIIVGTLIMGFAFSVFLEPNLISTGGFSGLSMMINVLLSKIGLGFIGASIIYFILNIGLFIYAYKLIGKKFAIKSIVGITSFSLAMEIFSYIPLDAFKFELLISAVYGGALMGVGVGWIIRFGGSTGGSDMIASIVRHKKPNFSAGKVIVVVDLIVIFLTLFVFANGVSLLPYTVLALILSSFTTDFINDGYKQVRAYYIITNKPTEVSEKIMNKLQRGCTLTNVVGMHSKEQKNMLLCLISRYQSGELKRIVKNVDEHAFIFSNCVSEVVGEWLNNSEIIKYTNQDEKPSNKDIKSEETNNLN